MHQLVAQNMYNKVLIGCFLLSFFNKTMAVIKKEKPDIVHAHWWIPAGIIGFAAARISNLPFVLTLHGTDVRLIETFPWLKPLARLITHFAARITVSSEYLRNMWTSLTGVSQAAVVKVPMPVGTEHIMPYEKARSHRLVTIARLSRQKGIHHLIDACGILKSKRRVFTLDIVGDGTERENLQRQVRSLGLSSCVSFHGSVSHDRVAHFLESAAMCILPSIDEGFGVVLLEALACGTPVIGSDSGGIREIIINDKTGLLVPPGDATSLAEAIVRLLSDKKLARKLAKTGHDFVLANFSADHVADTTQSMYREVLTQ